MSDSNNKIFSLSFLDTNILKGIAIVMMLCHHMYGGHEDYIEAYPIFFENLAVVGKVCVAIFLFCSGYGITAQYEKIISHIQNTKNIIVTSILFIIRRLIKFYSAYWLVFVIFIPIGVFVFNRSLSMAYGDGVNLTKRLIMDFWGIQGTSSYNMAWWFNKLIIICYLFFPFLFYILKKNRHIGILVSVILLNIANIFTSINYYDILIWQFPFVLGIFWYLNLSSKRLDSIAKWINQHHYSSLLLAIIFLLICSIQRIYEFIPISVFKGICFDGIFTLSIIFFMIIVLRQYSRLCNILQFLGRHSINIYLIHTFFNGYWEWFYLGMHTNKICRFLGLNMWLLLLICLIISIILEYVKEKSKINKITELISIKIDSVCKR